MRQSSGFTLIELLLVLAIIGIISAIAIPAMLAQRARARDKTAVDNVATRVGDIVGQYDKFREMGIASTQIVSSLNNYLAALATKDQNPWNTTGHTTAYNLSMDTSVSGKTTASGFATGIAGLVDSSKLGQVQFAIQMPSGNIPGFIGAAVYLNASTLSDTTPHIRTKVTAVE